MERLAREWVEIYPMSIPEVILVRDKKIIDINSILSDSHPEMIKYEDIKIDQYPEDVYETSSNNLINLTVLQFIKLKNWVSRVFL